MSTTSPSSRDIHIGHTGRALNTEAGRREARPASAPVSRYQCAHGRVPKFCAQCIVPVAAEPVRVATPAAPRRAAPAAPRRAAPVAQRRAAPVAQRTVAPAAPLASGILTLHICVCGHTCTARSPFLTAPTEAPHPCRVRR